MEPAHLGSKVGTTLNELPQVITSHPCSPQSIHKMNIWVIKWSSEVRESLGDLMQAEDHLPQGLPRLLPPKKYSILHFPSLGCLVCHSAPQPTRNNREGKCQASRALLILPLPFPLQSCLAFLGQKYNQFLSLSFCLISWKESISKGLPLEQGCQICHVT